MKSVYLLTLVFLLSPLVEKEYLKNHYPNGKIMEQGWIVDGQKNDYWFYYYENGVKKEEGHYSNNQKINWWIFYDKNQTIVKKCEYKNNVLNGLTLIYKNGEIAFAEKYRMGQKIKSWNTLSEFKNDNN